MKNKGTSCWKSPRHNQIKTLFSDLIHALLNFKQICSSFCLRTGTPWFVAKTFNWAERQRNSSQTTLGFTSHYAKMTKLLFEASFFRLTKQTPWSIFITSDKSLKCKFPHFESVVGGVATFIISVRECFRAKLLEKYSRVDEGIRIKYLQWSFLRWKAESFKKLRKVFWGFFGHG